MKKARKTKEAARSSKKSNADEKNVPVRPPASARKRKAASPYESEVVDGSIEDKPSVDGVVDDIQATDDTGVGAIVLVTDDTNFGANVSRYRCWGRCRSDRAFSRRADRNINC
ncbi:hypothetical protein C1H46_025837 [Malus baccata]|uniref:Uncharacterized protein n=1 Tax=Malus baccata TaxID=106549 RepID=A0A540LQG4_MALBA|nr:hypothetical protein C1H46_025837 [Malus baccata]